MKAAITRFLAPIILCSLLIISFSSCSNNKELGNSANTEVTATADALQANTSQENMTSVEKTKTDEAKIIRNASIRFQVKDYEKSLTAIQNQIKNNQGYIQSSNENNNDNTLKSTLVIKVPAKNLDNLIQQLVSQSIYLDYRNINSEDVTTEFVDISARIKAKKAVELRYLDLLKQAKTIKEILEIENQLRIIREEIESTQARINHIKEQAAYSTITLEVYESNAGHTIGNNSFRIRIWNALQSGWEILLSLIIGLLYIWPFLLLIPLTYYGLKKFFQKYPPVR